MKEIERMPAMMAYLQDHSTADHVYVYRLRFFDDKEYVLERHDLSGSFNTRRNHLQILGTALGVYMTLVDEPQKACNELFLDDFPLTETPFVEELDPQIEP